MTRLTPFLFIALLTAGSLAHAQTVPAVANLSWTLPTQNSDGTPIPASGANSLVRVEGFLSAAVIAAVPAGTPTFTLTPIVTTTSQTFPIAAGGTVHVRLRVCNAALCSDLSNEVTILAPGKPGVPTNVTISITLT